MSDQRKSLSEVNGGKKRKVVFRNGTTTTTTTTTTTSTTTTTTTTKAATDVPGRTRLTPEAAANYIQQATEAIAASTSALAAASRSVNAENVKITLGPPLDGSNKAGNSSSTISFGNLDLAALKAGDLSYFTAAAASRNAKRTGTAAVGGAATNSANRKNDKEGLPCSEAEMKALMSMFVEIMGMSMDTEKLGKSSKKKNMGLLDPGWKWPADGMIPKEWDVLPPSYDEEEEEEDSLPDLDDVNELCRNQPQKIAAALAAASAQATNTPNTQTTSGSSGIAPVEWESLEQVAIEDAMEAEERARKAAKRREKKNRKKEKARKEAAAKAAEAAQKKREKSILSWRSRVVSACQSNEVSRLEALLSESPLRQKEEGEIITPHLEFLLPNIVAKNRQQADRGKEARAILAKYIFNTSLSVVPTPLRTGRSALHTACFYGEVDFVKNVVHEVSQHQDVVHPSYINATCQESGWAPLHYAVVSGSDDVMETLLAGGCDVKTRTNDTHTWRSNNGKGITARELAESVMAGNHEKVFETHGIALQEVSSHFLSHTEERRKFIKLLDRNIERLKDIERNGYTPRNDQVPVKVEEEEQPDIKRINSTVSDNSTRKKKKKKKKQQQQQQAAAEAAIPKTNNQTVEPIPTPENEKDPMVSALLGMGFTEKQIKTAAKALGGTDRATADDIVAWIFAEESGEHNNDNQTQPTRPVDVTPTIPEEDKSNAKAEDARVKEAKRLEEEAKRKEEERLAAQRLAAKREETRRRNREWNNRTQARQREEEQAKLVELRARAAATTQARNQTAAALNAPSASFFPVGQVTGATVHQAAATMNVAAPPFAQLKMPAQAHGNNNAMDGSHMKNGASKRGTKSETPTAILTRSDNMSVNPQLGQQNKASQAAQAAVYHYDQPSQGYPPMLDVSAQQYHQGPNDVVSAQGYPPMTIDPAASQGFLPLADIAPQGYPPDLSQQGYPPMGDMSAQGYVQVSGDMGSQPYSQMSVTDDATVSSLGSGVGKVGNASSVSSSIPPGFRPSSATLPTQTEEQYSYHVNENPLGEMRATAQEFVPSKFAQSQSHSQSQSHLPTAASTNTASSHFNASSATNDQAVTSRLRSLSMSDTANISLPAGPTTIPGITSSAFGASLLATPGQHLSSFDRLGVAPSSDQSPVPPSAASSVTGVSTLAEESLIAAPAAANMLETISSSGLSSTGSFDGGPPVSAPSGAAASSIWGDLNAGNASLTASNLASMTSTPLSTNATTATTGLTGLVGLPSLSTKDGSSGLLDRASGSGGAGILGPRLDGMTGQAAMESSGIGAGWGSSIMGGGNTGGSIW